MLRLFCAVMCALFSSVVLAEACLIELNIKQLGIYDKSCQENHDAPASVFKQMCDAHKGQENVTVKHRKYCPENYLAYCHLNIVAVNGGFRTYTYSPESVAGLKTSCFAEVGGTKRVAWVEK